MEHEFRHPFKGDGQQHRGEYIFEIQLLISADSHPASRGGRSGGLDGGHRQQQAVERRGQSVHRRADRDDVSGLLPDPGREGSQDTFRSGIHQRLHGSPVGQDDGLPFLPHGLGPVGQGRDGRRENDVAAEDRIGVHDGRIIAAGGIRDDRDLDGLPAGEGHQRRQGGKR